MVIVGEAIRDWFEIDTIGEVWCVEGKMGANVEGKSVAKMEEVVRVVENMGRGSEIENWETCAIFGKE